MPKLKYLIALAILLLAGQSEANPHFMALSGPTVGASCDSCTDGLIFSAYFEQDEDITNGSPCGCTTLGDEVGALVGDATIVTGADGYVNCPNAEDYIEFDISSFPTNGSMLIKFSYWAYESDTELVRFSGDANNYVMCKQPSAGDNRLYWVGNSVSIYAANQTGDDCVEATEVVWGVFRWQSPGGPSTLSTILYGLDEVSCEADTSASALTAMTVTPTKLRIGNNSANTGTVRIYSIKIWNTWAGAPTSGF